MKRTFIIILACLLLILSTGCSSNEQTAQIVATTLPVYTFCSVLCHNTPITVGQLIQDTVSCLHDYTLQVGQMRAIEGAELVVINGAGLEDFLSDALAGSKKIVDSSAGIDAVCHDHSHEHDGDSHGHDHGTDPHFWLSPEHAKMMAENICAGLTEEFPRYADTFSQNLATLFAELEQLDGYGKRTLETLTTRDLITFHDGFSYFAESFDLNILQAIEEEAGSETSAARLVELVQTVTVHDLPAVFVETNGSSASAQIVAAETGIAVYTLDTAISQGDYFEIMYHNIDTVKEALG